MADRLCISAEDWRQIENGVLTEGVSWDTPIYAHQAFGVRACELFLLPGEAELRLLMERKYARNDE